MSFNTQIVFSNSVVVFDATTFIEPVYPSTATEHPLEDGSSTSDHIINGNITLKIEGMISDSASLFGFFLTPTTTAEAFESFKRARDNLETVQVIADIDTFESMSIESVSFPRDPETGEALDIKLSLKQISIQDSSFVQEAAVVPSDDIADDVSGTESLGAQSTSGVDSSLLSSSLTDLINSISTEG